MNALFIFAVFMTWVCLGFLMLAIGAFSTTGMVVYGAGVMLFGAIVRGLFKRVE